MRHLDAIRGCGSLGAAIACLCVGAAALALGGSRDDVGVSVQPDPRKISFGRDVRPILVQNCLVCHGFDPSTRKAGLRLDTRDHATNQRANGRPQAIVPGDPDASLLIAKISAHDPVDRMPPEGQALSQANIEILRRWIAQGAAYERHWSLIPVANPPVPQVDNARFGVRPIDAFVRAKLGDAGLSPAPPADRRTLIRRLSFDLTGMPPTPRQIDAFVSDSRQDAYERLVDRLLGSARFGERWARHWLDLMRYAETYAHEYDYPIRHAWQYRDYLIRALNADVPYDMFVTEHVAGDLMASPRRNPQTGFNESIIGTGFWWLSQGTHSPVDVVQDEADRIDNQIDVFSKAFMATTVSCARCHDHKFDPILTREYYALGSFLQSSRRQDAYLDPDGDIERGARRMSKLQREAAAWVKSDGLRNAVPTTDETAALLLAAADVLHGDPGENEQPATARDLVIDSFDDGTYGRWTVLGEAFADGPVDSKDEPLHGQGTAKGAFLANSHRPLHGRDTAQTDALVGSIVSPPFTIRHDYLHFLIGGGNHPGRTGLRLMIDNEPVREATGRNGHKLRHVRFDLRELHGQTATIEIIDEATGGWGNTAIDEIVLSDEAQPDRPARRSIEAVATEHAIDPAVLRAWTQTLQDADENDASDPLAPWVRAAALASGDASASIGDAIASQDPPPSDASVLENFNAISLGEWSQAGWAFDRGITERGEVVGRELRLSDATCVDSGGVSPRLVGTLRSPTFEITHPFLATRARGKGALRVIINGYTMDEYNPLLFERARIMVDAPSWRWHIHDVSKWIGHRAHYEIIDDEAYGSIAVERLVFLDEDRAPAERGWSEQIAQLVGEHPSLVNLAKGYGLALSSLRNGEPSAIGLAIGNRLISMDRADGMDESTIAALVEIERLEENLPSAMRVTAMIDGTGYNGHVYVRGSHKTPGRAAPRGFLGAFCDDPSMSMTSGSGRLELADALLDPSNPLPARVAVNRVWHHLFGRGIVESTDNFGLQGKSPTHPLLLDHLARRFTTDMGWSLKTLIREIVLSETYRMASGPLGARASRIDPTNRLLSVRQARRLDGESIRDAILHISARLDETMHGPSVPIHLTGFMTGRGRPGRSGPLDGAGRRSIYQEVRRNFASPMMQAFDTPNPHSTIGKRSVSNVPAQSLILLNDPFIVEQSRLLAERVTGEREDAVARIERLYGLVLGRLPSPDERARAIAFIGSQARSYSESGATDDAEASAWSDLAHVLFNLKEFVFLR